MNGKKEKRFYTKYKQGLGELQILVDKQTGVNYLFYAQGYSGGLTILVDRDGKPVISSTSEIEGLE